MYCTLLNGSILNFIVLNGTLLYCTVPYCTVLYSTVLCCAVLCCAVLYCTVLYSTVLYCTVQYCIVLYCTVLAIHALHLFIFSSYVTFILFYWMFLFLRGFWFSHIYLIRAGGCRTAFIATWLSKFLSSLWWLGACTEYNTMKLQLPMQDDVAAGEYAQNSSRRCWWKVTIYLSNDLVNFKTYFIILQQRRWITKGVFSQMYVLISKSTAPYVWAVPTENQIWMASIWGFGISRSSKIPENKYIK